MNIDNEPEEASCSLCGSLDKSIYYQGNIRGGGIGSKFLPNRTVYKCESCSFVYLDSSPENLRDFYESDEYRTAFDYKVDIPSLQKKFDSAQSERISRIGIERLRDKKIADFGAGPGIFIDSVKDIASETFVVEPSVSHRKYLSENGHHCFAYGHDLIKLHALKIDLVVSFDTIEHIPNFKVFVREIFEALRPGGTFVLSMPNLKDIVRQIHPEAYEPFFFQAAHVNYFDDEASYRLLSEAGFKSIKIDFLHKYNINNAFQWARFGNPGTFDIGSDLDRSFHDHYVTEIERLGLASHLFIEARK